MTDINIYLFNVTIYSVGFISAFIYLHLTGHTIINKTELTRIIAHLNDLLKMQ